MAGPEFDAVSLEAREFGVGWERGVRAVCGIERTSEVAADEDVIRISDVLVNIISRFHDGSERHAYVEECCGLPIAIFIGCQGEDCPIGSRFAVRQGPSGVTACGEQN
mgnify:CR=1 FL=1